ncbi:MAG: T9SS type A sorting domain-containing protein [candidate division WOR-3 bacterium]
MKRRLFSLPTTLLTAFIFVRVASSASPTPEITSWEGPPVPEPSDKHATIVELGHGRFVSRIHPIPTNRPDASGGWEPIPLSDSTKQCYPQSIENWTGAVRLQSSNYTKQTGLIQFSGRCPTSQPRYQGWAMFDLSPIPDNCTVDTVQLAYYCNSVGSEFPSTYLTHVDSNPVNLDAQRLWSQIRDGYQLASPLTHGLYWQYRSLNSVGVARVQASLPRNWIALGFWEFHEQNNSGAYGSAYGYGSGQYTPYLEIKFTLPLQTDISAEEVLAPVGNIITNTVVTPAARWRNRQPHPDNFIGFFTLISPGGLRTTRAIAVNGIPGLSDTVLYFPPFDVGTDTGRWTARCSTYASGDIDTANNIIERYFYVVPPGSEPTNIDVQASQILSPPIWVDTGTTVTPLARYRNLGTLPADFNALFSLTDPLGTRVYSRSIPVVGLAPGADTTVEFPGHEVGALVGRWAARCSILAPNDTNPDNNWCEQPFIVYAGRPPWTPGWVEVRPMPLTPSGRGIKDGGWLTLDPGEGLFYVAKGNKVGDFYCYNPITDTWFERALWKGGTEGKGPAKGSVGVADGHGHIYATKGANTLGFWCYHADGDSWQQLRDVPAGNSGKKVKGGTDLVYVEDGGFSYVYLLKGGKNDFLRYAVSGDSWTQLPDAPTGFYSKWDKGSWMVCDGDQSIYAHKAKRHEFWRFDLATAQWDTHRLEPMPFLSRTGKNKKAKDGGAGAYDYSCGTIYALKGGNTTQFFRYYVDDDTWEELDTMPSVGSTGKKKRVKGGGDLCRYDVRHVFALKGNKTLELWYYFEPPVLVTSANEKRRAAAESGATTHGHPTQFTIIARPELTQVSLDNDFSGRCRLAMFDVTGSVVAFRQSTARSGIITVDLGDLPAGIYLARIETDKMSYVRKLILNR